MSRALEKESVALTTKKKKVELPDQIISLFKKVLRDDV